MSDSLTPTGPLASTAANGEQPKQIGNIVREFTQQVQNALAARDTYEDDQEAQPKIEPCRICNGAGWLIVSKAPPGHPDFCKTQMCECRRAEVEAAERVKRERLSGIGPLRRMRLETFNPDVPHVRRAYLRAMEYARAPRGWLVLAGGYGCGKTHLAAGIANAAIDRGDDVIFQVVPDLLDSIRASYSPESDMSFDEQFDLIRNTSLLVLDDLGTEQATAWARDKLYRIINHRYNHQLPTVFTTNVWPDGIEPRLASRLADRDLSGGVVLIQANDYRQRAA